MFEIFLMVTGFVLAAYACVSNDVIQTLGTFLSSNEKRSTKSIWLFASLILVLTVVYGWVINDGDISYHRLDKIPFVILEWYHLLPPVVLLILTRFGVPVSTTFLLLMVFSSSIVIEKMIIKSVCGYMVAFSSAIILYSLIAKIEKKFLNIKERPKGWVIAQWIITAWLFSTWLSHDLANIFVYLPRKLDLFSLIISLTALVGMLGLLCYFRGGQIQKIVKKKTNTVNVCSATIIDLFYVFILIFFKEINTIPMSTTWVFIGFLAGRELGLHYQLHHKSSKKVWADIGKDFFKVVTGLVVSVLMVYLILMVKGC